jgi:hypothetical protein
MSQLDEIRKIVANTDEHRNRARRESWDAIKAVLAGEDPKAAPVVEESPVVTEEPVVEEEPEHPVRRGPGRPRGS